jgi:putative flippase GtrA
MISRHFLMFVMVGGIGFSIEAVLLTAFTLVPWLNPITSRLISFPVAVSATWWLNRRLTFKSNNHPGKEGLLYLLVQTLGVLVNLLVYGSLVAAFPVMRAYPVLALFFGSACGLVVNFSLSKKIVFAPRGKR